MMLSPNDIAPKSKAASIWSFDSGYGSTTLEDDEALQVPFSTSLGLIREADTDVYRPTITEPQAPTTQILSRHNRLLAWGWAAFGIFMCKTNYA